MKLKAYFFSGLTSIATLLSPVKAAAQVNLNESFFNSHPGATVFQTSLGGVISLILPNVIVLAGILFFLLILYYGFSYLTHSRQGSVQIAQKDKNILTYGAIGLLLVIASYFILQIISTVTGIDFTNTPIT